MDMDLAARRATAQKIEEEGIVLLKNEGVLPLRKERVFVTGAPAFRYYFGGGSSNVYPEREFEPLADALGSEGAFAEFAESVWEVQGHQAILGNLKAAVVKAAESDVTVLCVGEPDEVGSWPCRSVGQGVGYKACLP